MTAIELFSTLFRQMEWADAAVWSAVLASPAACADAGLRERLHHVHLVQRVFLSFRRGEAIDVHAGEERETSALAGWARECYPEVHAGRAGGDRRRRARPSDRGPVRAEAAKRFRVEPRQPAVGETLVQVFAHTAHHRGQINLRLRELGGEPPLIDFIAWLWRWQPAAGWPGACAERGTLRRRSVGRVNRKEPRWPS